MCDDLLPAPCPRCTSWSAAVCTTPERMGVWRPAAPCHAATGTGEALQALEPTKRQLWMAAVPVLACLYVLQFGL